METVHCIWQSRPVRHCHARWLTGPSFLTAARLLAAWLLALSLTFEWLQPMPIHAQGGNTPDVSTDVGSDGFSVSAGTGSNSSPGGGNSGSNNPGSSTPGGGGGSYFTIVLPGSGDSGGGGGSGYGSDAVAQSLYQCASAGASVNYNGGGSSSDSSSANHGGGAQSSTRGDRNDGAALSMAVQGRLGIEPVVYRPGAYGSHLDTFAGAPTATLPAPTPQAIAQNPTAPPPIIVPTMPPAARTNVPASTANVIVATIMASAPPPQVFSLTASANSANNVATTVAQYPGLAPTAIASPAAAAQRTPAPASAAHTLSTNPCANGNSSRLMRNVLATAGGGTGGRRQGQLILACTANLGGALSAGLLMIGSQMGFNVGGLIPFTNCFPVDPNADAPCRPTSGSGLALNCAGDARTGWSFNGKKVRVSVSIPPVRVIRSPFPRGLVTIANLMTLDGAPTTTGEKWSNAIDFPNQGYIQRGVNYSTCSLDPHPHSPPCDGDVRNYQLGAKLDRLAPDSAYPLGHVEKACWTWGDWLPVKTSDCGMSAQHTYETSSNADVNSMGGKIKGNGPRADLHNGTVPSWDEESYQASVPTFWAGSYNIRYEQASVSFTDDWQGNCGVNHTGPSCIEVWTPHVSWHKVEFGWHTIDLRKYGKANWYYPSYKQYECGLFNGQLWCQQQPPPDQDGSLPVNILKSNPVLIEPCDALGICQ